MQPEVITQAHVLRAVCEQARASGKRVGFVPTMGALHEGHLSLVNEARRRADFVVVSVFVNPTQFGPGEDFERYPRDLAADVAKLSSASVVFAPDVTCMYPQGDSTRVSVAGLSMGLCGAHRPGHFDGVAQVVTKLFCLVGPSVAVFGKKDYQQLAIIRRLVRDLFLPIEVVGHAIVRESDGVAMSSRNAYLTASERQRACGISRGLFAAARAFAGGERRVAELHALVHRDVVSVADAIDYVTVSDPDTLEPLDAPVQGASKSASVLGPDSRALLAVACRVGRTRLIDNFVLGEDAMA